MAELQRDREAAEAKKKATQNQVIVKSKPISSPVRSVKALNILKFEQPNKPSRLEKTKPPLKPTPIKKVDAEPVIHLEKPLIPPRIAEQPKVMPSRKAETHWETLMPEALTPTSVSEAQTEAKIEFEPLRTAKSLGISDLAEHWDNNINKLSGDISDSTEALIASWLELPEPVLDAGEAAEQLFYIQEDAAAEAMTLEPAEIQERAAEQVLSQQIVAAIEQLEPEQAEVIEFIMEDLAAKVAEISGLFDTTRELPATISAPEKLEQLKEICIQLLSELDMGRNEQTFERMMRLVLPPEVLAAIQEQTINELLCSVHLVDSGTHERKQLPSAISHYLQNQPTTDWLGRCLLAFGTHVQLKLAI